MSQNLWFRLPILSRAKERNDFTSNLMVKRASKTDHLGLSLSPPPLAVKVGRLFMSLCPNFLIYKLERRACCFSLELSCRLSQSNPQQCVGPGRLMHWFWVWSQVQTTLESSPESD